MVSDCSKRQLVTTIYILFLIFYFSKLGPAGGQNVVNEKPPFPQDTEATSQRISPPLHSLSANCGSPSTLPRRQFKFNEKSRLTRERNFSISKPASWPKSFATMICTPQSCAIPEISCRQCDALSNSFRTKPHAGIARRAGRSPSGARKLPQQGPRSPREMTERGKPQRGASGGMQGGPRRGRSPITGPALPHAAQAAKTTEMKKLRARRAQKPHLKGQALLCFLRISPTSNSRAG